MSFLLLFFILPQTALTSNAGNKFEENVPAILQRVKVVREILLPLPSDVMSEGVHHLAGLYIPVNASSELCRRHSNLVYDNFIKQELWALRLVDASSKLGSGILDGNIMDLGNYDQCVSVMVPGNAFRGRHCFVQTHGLMPPQLDMVNPERSTITVLRFDVSMSICVPSSCTPDDVKTHLDITLNSVNATAILHNTSCSLVDSQPFQLMDYATMVILVTITALVLASTIYSNLVPVQGQRVLLTLFSLSLNTKQLLSAEQSADRIPCLHGLRVLTMAWVILGHRFISITIVPNIRPMNIEENIQNLNWALMIRVQSAVEIFFFLSGTLSAYNFFKDRKKGKIFNYTKFFIHRYRRLIGPLAVMVLLQATLIVRVTDGPIWRQVFTQSQQNCQKYWWTTLLFISNYVNVFELCLLQTWYVCADFQLYVLSPLILLVLHKHVKLGLLTVAVGFTATTVAGAVNAYVNNLRLGSFLDIDRTNEEMYTIDYMNTHFRAGSFLLGIVLGFVIFNCKYNGLTIKITKFQLWLGWLLAVSVFIAVVFSVKVFQSPDYVPLPIVDVPFHILSRPGIALCVGWVILVCITGHCDVVDSLLSWGAFLPLSRLSYCVYLVHLTVQSVQTQSTRTLINTNTANLWYIFFGDLMVSHLVALVLYFGVEAPISNIIKYSSKKDS